MSSCGIDVKITTTYMSRSPSPRPSNGRSGTVVGNVCKIVFTALVLVDVTPSFGVVRAYSSEFLVMKVFLTGVSSDLLT
jgi:hypothetical protein